MFSRPSSPSRVFFRVYAVAWLFLVLVAAIFIAAGVGSKEYLLSESGPVEMASVIGYLICVFAIARLGAGWAGRWPAAGLLLMFALRELDFHSRFTTMNLSKIKFYLSPEVPVLEKFLGGAVVGLFFYLAYRLFSLEWRAMLSDLKQGRACAYGVFFAVLSMLVSKSLDGFARKLGDIGVMVSAQASNHASTLEEVLELGIPLMIGMSILCYYRHGRSGG